MKYPLKISRVLLLSTPALKTASTQATSRISQKLLQQQVYRSSLFSFIFFLLLRIYRDNKQFSDVEENVYNSSIFRHFIPHEKPNLK